MRCLCSCLAFVSLLLATTSGGGVAAPEEDLVLHDQARNREIPVHVYQPASGESGGPGSLRPVALLSGGYGESPRAYSFLAKALAARGFLVVSVQHDLPGDPPIPKAGNVFEVRSPSWKRGSENLLFVRADLRARYPGFAWEHPLLLGHSNGGDISVWLARDHPSVPAAVVTLDHRRMPLPRLARPKVLSLRGADFPADAGVLPSAEEQREFGIEIISLPGGKHDDMVDAGPEELKRAIIDRVAEFLRKVNLGADGVPAPSSSPGAPNVK